MYALFHLLIKIVRYQHPFCLLSDEMISILTTEKLCAATILDITEENITHLHKYKRTISEQCLILLIEKHFKIF